MFIKPPKKPSRSSNKPESVVIFSGHRNPTCFKQIRKSLSLICGVKKFPPITLLEEGPHFFPKLSSDQARILVQDILFSQKFAKVRKRILFQIGPFLYKTPQWRVANMFGLCARESTIRNYLTQIRAFALFSEKPILSHSKYEAGIVST